MTLSLPLIDNMHHVPLLAPEDIRGYVITGNQFSVVDGREAEVKLNQWPLINSVRNVCSHISSNEEY